MGLPVAVRQRLFICDCDPRRAAIKTLLLIAADAVSVNLGLSKGFMKPWQ